ncbi:MAG: hypothetical protein NC124_08020 [Clostridium sp.]|nr:hypothetical protein [Clostridium sp.]
MKKMILGIAWQVMGFLGAIIILCSAAPHDWDYHGITGIIGNILGLGLMLPFLVCVVLIVAGLVLCFKCLNEK